MGGALASRAAGRCSCCAAAVRHAGGGSRLTGLILIQASLCFPSLHTQEWKSTLFGRIANFYKQEEKKASDGGKKEITRVEPWGVARYTPFSPFIGCNGMKMQRLGSSGDGGKMVCMHKELQTPGCVVYSLGSSGNLDFERSVLEVGKVGGIARSVISGCRPLPGCRCSWLCLLSLKSLPHPRLPLTTL